MVNKLKPPFVLCALFMFAPVTHALQVSVAGLDGNPCNFPSIQTAIDAAVQAGGSHVVYVNSDLGSHAENVVIPDGAEVSIFAVLSSLPGVFFSILIHVGCGVGGCLLAVAFELQISIEGGSVQTAGPVTGGSRL